MICDDDDYYDGCGYCGCWHCCCHYSDNDTAAVVADADAAVDCAICSTKNYYLNEN